MEFKNWFVKSSSIKSDCNIKKVWYIRARYYSVKVHWSLWFFSQQWKISKHQTVKIPDQRSALFFHEAAFFQWWLPLPDTFVTSRHVHSCRREAEHEGILVFSCTCMNPDSKGYCCSQFVPFHMKSVREKKVFTYWVEYGLQITEIVKMNVHSK